MISLPNLGIFTFGKLGAHDESGSISHEEFESRSFDIVYNDIPISDASESSDDE